MNIIGYALNQRRLRRTFLISITVAVIMANTNVIGLTKLLACSQWYAPNAGVSSLVSLGLFVNDVFLTTSPVAFIFLYSYFLLSIRIRFCLLNLALRNAVKSSKGTRGLHAEPSLSRDVIDLLNSFSMQHDSLTNGIKIINECYSFQVRHTWLT